MRSKLLAYVLCVPSLFLIAGLHRFYAGKVFSGLLWLITAGLFGIGTIIDLVLIPGMIDGANLRSAVFGRRSRPV